ncbi:hypothetical protein [Streptomyces sp. bgisy034]|uniref:hypothetical protein n=1 Tax=Streptomyces sp. bgisy034 TaxID=3413774 RepID=UPI003EC0798A
MDQDYESEAHVVIDGEEFPVRARFTVFMDGPLKSWRGYLATDEPGLSFKLIAARRTVLRMPEGKEAPIVPTGDDTGSGVAFAGSGPAPV